MAGALKESGLNLIREYIPDSPIYNPEEEPGQYNLQYVPQSPANQPAITLPEYIPSATVNVPELTEIEEDATQQCDEGVLEPEEDANQPDEEDGHKPGNDETHIKHDGSPTSPLQDEVSIDIATIGTTQLVTTTVATGPIQLVTASVHPTSDASIIIHSNSESSAPPQVVPIPVDISRGIPPDELSDSDLDEELHHPDHPIKTAKEEGEWTEEEDIPPLVDFSDDDTQAKDYPPDPWNDDVIALQDK